MRVQYAYHAEHEWELSLFTNDIVEVINEFAEEEVVKELQLLTAKKQLYLLNG